MPEKSLIIALNARDIALALVQVVQMWSNERYSPFLLQPTSGELTEEWFRWFVGAWNVARTIKSGKQKFVREYLDRDFRAKLLKGGDADAVDEAAEHIQHQGWSLQKRKDGKGSLPISLVSKVGDFLCPTKLVPLDRYALCGLNILQGVCGEPRLNGQSYIKYLHAFNEHYLKMEPQLATTLEEPRGVVLAKKLGCSASNLSSIALRRKFFDAYLMRLGNYPQ